MGVTINNLNMKLADKSVKATILKVAPRMFNILYFTLLQFRITNLS